MRLVLISRQSEREKRSLISQGLVWTSCKEGSESKEIYCISGITSSSLCLQFLEYGFCISIDKVKGKVNDTKDFQHFNHQTTIPARQR